MREVQFTSVLDPSYQDALHDLLFFNSNQQRTAAGAILAIERYGKPQISTANGRLWVTFDSRIEAQSLFVLEPASSASRTPENDPSASQPAASQPLRNELVGLTVYTREADTLAVLFVAVRADYAWGGAQADGMLFFRILEEIAGIAGRVRGITSIKLFFSNPPATFSVSGVKALAARRRVGGDLRNR